jgi:hypothetical protein
MLAAVVGVLLFLLGGAAFAAIGLAHWGSGSNIGQNNSSSSSSSSSSPPPSNLPAASEKNEEDTSQTVSIRVTGTPGVAFSGRYAVASGVSSGPLEGVTPQDFEIPVQTEADGVAANVRKLDEGAEELTLQLLVGGEVVAEKSTTEQFGWVSV